MSSSTPPERRHARARVGYLGPEGTFSEEALLASALAGAVTAVPQASIYETVSELREGRLDWAVVPVENSLDGSVTVTLDLLAEEAGQVRIVGEALLAVRHSLIGCAEVELPDITTVLTHPQVPGQCARFLRGELPGARVLPAASTAEAVRTVVAEGHREQAALGTALAAEIYGGVLLRDGVQDRDDNQTRFLWLGPGAGGSQAPMLEAREGRWKTSLVFWGSGAGRPGWLVRCLDEFARRDINLTKIESRPRRDRLGSYMFFADLTGDARDARVGEAVDGMAALCEEVRVLGSYREAAARDAMAPA